MDDANDFQHFTNGRRERPIFELDSVLISSPDPRDNPTSRILRPARMVQGNRTIDAAFDEPARKPAEQCIAGDCSDKDMLDEDFGDCESDLEERDDSGDEDWIPVEGSSSSEDDLPADDHSPESSETIEEEEKVINDDESPDGSAELGPSDSSAGYEVALKDSDSKLGSSTKISKNQQQCRHNLNDGHSRWVTGRDKATSPDPGVVPAECSTTCAMCNVVMMLRLKFQWCSACGITRCQRCAGGSLQVQVVERARCPGRKFCGKAPEW